MLKLEIVTPEKRVLDAEVESVTVPTASGEAGIFPNHAPLVSALKPGILSYSQKGGAEKLAVSGGFVEVSGNKVSVLADTAETSDEVDVELARTEREAAEKALAAAATSPVEENAPLLQKLESANARITLAGAGK
ncbi:MAG: F0F1 ATP synthase subunit epsilon [Acidobacteria bacterium ACB1]|nr:ATP synthase epsilon chain [Pyrinomonadaceae bacterium]MCE7962994.1 F0F1 ATP synthase subunit epsilon [Acidobacteria bacterium ACB1]RIJ94664.1 MAG: F0F1 ATP synthase subunit epsilon [Acidobacteriota bacterium]